MRLVFGHLCDYSTCDALGKPIIVGVFDVFHSSTPDERVRTPDFYLMLGIEAPTIEGVTHDIVARLLDADGKDLGAMRWGNVRFGTRFIGQAATAYLSHKMNPLELPFGDYVFEIAVERKRSDGNVLERLGEVAFHVVRLEVAPQASASPAPTS